MVVGSAIVFPINSIPVKNTPLYKNTPLLGSEIRKGGGGILMKKEGSNFSKSKGGTLTLKKKVKGGTLCPPQAKNFGVYKNTPPPIRVRSVKRGGILNWNTIDASSPILKFSHGEITVTRPL